MKAFLNDKFKSEYPRSITKHSAQNRLHERYILSAISMSYCNEQRVHAHCITSVMPENAARELSLLSGRDRKLQLGRPEVEPLIAKVA